MLWTRRVFMAALAVLPFAKPAVAAPVRNGLPAGAQCGWVDFAGFPNQAVSVGYWWASVPWRDELCVSPTVGPVQWVKEGQLFDLSRQHDQPFLFTPRSTPDIAERAKSLAFKKLRAALAEPIP